MVTLILFSMTRHFVLVICNGVMTSLNRVHFMCKLYAHGMEQECVIELDCSFGCTLCRHVWDGGRVVGCSPCAL